MRDNDERCQRGSRQPDRIPRKWIADQDQDVVDDDQEKNRQPVIEAIA